MNKLVQVILVTEVDCDPYVLSTGTSDYAAAQQLMQFRAEELLDELISEDGGETSYVIEVNDENTATTIKVEESGTIVATLEITSVEIMESEV